MLDCSDSARANSIYQFVGTDYRPLVNQGEVRPADARLSMLLLYRYRHLIRSAVNDRMSDWMMCSVDIAAVTIERALIRTHWRELWWRLLSASLPAAEATINFVFRFHEQNYSPFYATYSYSAVNCISSWIHIVKYDVVNFMEVLLYRLVEKTCWIVLLVHVYVSFFIKTATSVVYLNLWSSEHQFI